VQIDVVDNEASTEDINHNDAREQPPPVTTTMIPVLWGYNKDHQPSMKYNAQEYILLN